MSTDDPVVVIGAGLMGAAAACELARRGRQVIVLEQFALGHSRGSSHGSARIVRRVYSDPVYRQLTGRAFELWHELEEATGTRLLRMLGGIDFGMNRDVRALSEELSEAAVPHEFLPAAEAGRRWAGMVFDGEVVFHPQAGTLDADAAIRALLARAEHLGAEVRPDTAVMSLKAGADDVTVHCSDSTVLRTGALVVAAGAWLGPLLDGVVALPRLQVTQEQVFHFPRLDRSARAWPSTIHEGGQTMYHLAGGVDGGAGDDRKLGEHHGGTATTADARDGVVSDQSRRRAIDYVRRWLPGLDGTPSSETTCLYTRTASEDFVLDRVGPVIVCSPCSGHGAKFAPLIGRFVADLVDGTADLPDRFRIGAHARA